MLPAVLSELRLLASARLDSHILLTVVLAGDGRLVERLRSDEFLPLGSRMRVRLALDRASPDELADCLKQALRPLVLEPRLSVHSLEDPYSAAVSDTGLGQTLPNPAFRARSGLPLVATKQGTFRIGSFAPPHHWLSLSVEPWIARRLSYASKRICPALLRAALRSGPPGICCAALSAASAARKSNSHRSTTSFCVFMHHRYQASE